MSLPPASTRPPGQSPQSSQQSYRPPAEPALQQRAWAAMLMSLIGLFGMMSDSGGNVQRGVYVIVAAVVIAAVALWLAVTSMTRARRIGSSRPRGAIFATVLGAIGLGIGGVMLVTYAVLWPQLTRYSRCESGAGTIASQNACYQQLLSSVNMKEINFISGARR